MIKKTIYIILLSLITGVVSAQGVLEKYIDEAVQNNPGVQAGYTAYEATLERVPQVKALPDPTLSASYQVMPVETRLGPQRGKVSVMQMFPWFGTLDVKGQKAAKMAEAKYNIYLAERNKISMEVKQIWYDIYAVSEQIEFTRLQIELIGKLEKHATTKYENSKAGMTDVIQFGIMGDEMLNKLEKQKEKLNTLHADFNLILNRDANATVLPADKILSEEIITIPSIDKIQNNPMLLASQSGVEAARIQTELAKLNGRPMIGVGVDYVVVGKRTDMAVENSGRDALMPMVSMTLPIWRKKYKAMKKESAFVLKQSELSKDAVLNNLKTKYFSAIEKYKNAEKDAELYIRLTEKTELAFKLVQTSYINSGKDLEQVLRLQSMLYKYQLALVKAQSNKHKSYSSLMYITGIMY